MRMTVSGRWAAAKRRVAQQLVVVRHGRGAAPRARERIGQQRGAEGGRRGGQRRGEAVVALVAAGHDDRALAGLEVDRGGAGAERRARGRGASSAAGSGASSTSGSRSAKFRCTAPGRPDTAVS